MTSTGSLSETVFFLLHYFCTFYSPEGYLMIKDGCCNPVYLVCVLGSRKEEMAGVKRASYTVPFK